MVASTVFAESLRLRIPNCYHWLHLHLLAAGTVLVLRFVGVGLRWPESSLVLRTGSTDSALTELSSIPSVLHTVPQFGATLPG